MVTSASRRAAAVTVLGLALLWPAGTVGTAWADEPSPSAAPEAQPTAGTWISGGTLLESQQTAARPAVQAPATTPRTTVRHDPFGSAPPPAVLPFTGPHRVDVLLPTGLALLAAGAALTLVARPRRSSAQLRS